jgi:hypothetical protein
MVRGENVWVFRYVAKLPPLLDDVSEGEQIRSVVCLNKPSGVLEIRKCIYPGPDPPTSIELFLDPL